MSDFILFGAPLIGDAEIEEVVETLRSGWLGTGPRVAQFEQEFSAYKGVSGAVALNSCTASLHLAICASGIGPGDEVITTPLTFAATVNAIIHCGATPVLADVDPITMNISVDAIEEKLTPRTRAIVPVHFAGRPCDMNRICKLVADHGLILIEDCAHAIEAQYHGRQVGTFGDFGCFSFYVTKNVVTGEGGMVIARDAAALARIQILALHGMSKDAWKRFSDAGYVHYDVVEVGFKYNMMDLQAAIGIHQLRRVEESWNRRQEIWNIYLSEFSDLPVTLPSMPEDDTRHAYHLFTMLIDQAACGVGRDDFLTRMNSSGIGCGVHYRAIPEMTVYQQRFGWRPEQWPHASRIGRQTVSLPLSPRLTDSEIARIVEAVKVQLR